MSGGLLVASGRSFGHHQPPDTRTVNLSQSVGVVGNDIMLKTGGGVVQQPDRPAKTVTQGTRPTSAMLWSRGVVCNVVFVVRCLPGMSV